MNIQDNLSAKTLRNITLEHRKKKLIHAVDLALMCSWCLIAMLTIYYTIKLMEL